MAKKNAILRHVPYNAVCQGIGKTAASLPHNGGPATPQRRPRYTATEAPLHRNGGSITPQREPYCIATGAPLQWAENTVAAHSGKQSISLWHKIPQQMLIPTLIVQKTLSVSGYHAIILGSYNLQTCMTNVEQARTTEYRHNLYTIRQRKRRGR